MSLLTEARDLAKRSGGTCGVAKMGLSPQEQAELVEALSAPVSAQAISDALKARGHAVSSQTVARHRNGTCSCPR